MKVEYGETGLVCKLSTTEVRAFKRVYAIVNEMAYHYQGQPYGAPCEEAAGFLRDAIALAHAEEESGEETPPDDGDETQ